jgi:hypothetical protein
LPGDAVEDALTAWLTSLTVVNPVNLVHPSPHA